MSRDRYRPGEIIANFREADVLLSQGAEALRAIEIREVASYR